MSTNNGHGFSDLSISEQAKVLALKYDSEGLTYWNLSKTYGISKTLVSRRIALSRLHVTLLSAVDKDSIPLSHAEIIAKAELTPEQQQKGLDLYLEDRPKKAVFIQELKTLFNKVIPETKVNNNILVKRTASGVWQASGETYFARIAFRRGGWDFDGNQTCWYRHDDDFGSDVEDVFGVTAQELIARYAQEQAEQDDVTKEPIVEVEPDPSVAPEQAIVDPETGIVLPSWWHRLERYLSRSIIAIVGPSGNGKTVGSKAMLEKHYGADGYIEIDINEFVTPEDLVGMMVYNPSEGKRNWEDGQLAAAIRQNKAILINEFDAANPRVVMALQSFMQDGGAEGSQRYLTLPGNPHESSVSYREHRPLIVTMNTIGGGATRQYSGRNKLDAASRDRMTLIQTNYENDAAILQARGASQSIAAKIEQWAWEMRQKIDDNALNITLSPRTLWYVAESIEKHAIAFEQAIREEFGDKLNEDDRDTLGLMAHAKSSKKQRFGASY